MCSVISLLLPHKRVSVLITSISSRFCTSARDVSRHLPPSSFSLRTSLVPCLSRQIMHSPVRLFSFFRGFTSVPSFLWPLPHSSLTMRWRQSSSQRPACSNYWLASSSSLLPLSICESIHCCCGDGGTSGRAGGDAAPQTLEQRADGRPRFANLVCEKRARSIRANERTNLVRRRQRGEQRV